jgi:hypothetical protein
MPIPIMDRPAAPPLFGFCTGVEIPHDAKSDSQRKARPWDEPRLHAWVEAKRDVTAANRPGGWDQS